MADRKQRGIPGETAGNSQLRSKTFETTIVRDRSTCFIPLPFDPAEVFGKLRAPVKVTLNGYTFPSTIASMCGIVAIPFRQSNREAAGLEGKKPSRSGSISTPRSVRSNRRPIWSKR